MSKIILKKNGTDYPLLTMPNHYPADRVYLDGDTTKTVQDAISYREIYTASGNQTYKAQLQELAPYVSALSTYDKFRSLIIRGNQIFRYNNAISNGYIMIAIDSANELIQYFDINNVTAVKREINGQTISGADITNNTDANALQLVLMN